MATELKKYGKQIDSEESWQQMAGGYANELTNDYHAHRLGVIDALIPKDVYQEGKNLFDFGCGDAVHFAQFLKKGANIRGVDVAAEMISLAKQRLSDEGSNPDLVNVGGADELAQIESKSLDAILSFNVLAYLTDEEEKTFYEHANRTLKPGGYLVTTHSNELFDMYSLNNYTVDFFRRHLVTDTQAHANLSPLLTRAEESEQVQTYNVRENPLSYSFKLAKYGFEEQRQEFINMHAAPPSLMPKERSYPNTLSWSEEDRWKLMFTCSTYGSLAIRKD